MRTTIIFTFFFLFAIVNSNSQNITITKNDSETPDDVCNLSKYEYVIDTTYTNGVIYSIELNYINVQLDSQNGNIYKLKWESTSIADGYISKFQAKLKQGDTVIDEAEIEVTIKSIKHLEPQIIGYETGGVLVLPACNTAQEYFEVTKLIVPGTGDINPDKIYDYMWTIPSDWTLNGHTSDGTNEIAGGSYVTVSYPASSTNGSIKVRGASMINGCSAEMQYSKYSAVTTVKRDVEIEISSDSDWLFCGETNPVTYTVTTVPQLPCAVYYWNNSTTGTTNNTFTYTPDGVNDFTVFVNVVYGNSNQIVSETIEYKVTDPDHSPHIDGNDVICTDPTQHYTIDNVPSHYSVNWLCSGPIELVDGQGTNNAEFKDIGTGEAIIKAKITTPCGDFPSKPFLYMTKNIWVGAPEQPGIQSLDLCGNTEIEINATSDSPVNYYNWTISCGTIVSGDGTSCIFVEPNCNCYEIYVRLQTES